MKYIVYLTVCSDNKKSYIGVHKTLDPNIFDGYIGCGVDCQGSTKLHHPKTPFQFAVKKYGYNSFYRITLKVFDVESDAYELEKELVTEAWIADKNNYNITTGGFGGKREVNCKPILQYSKEGVFIKEFSSVADALRELNLNPNKSFKLTYACKDPSINAYGYKWKLKTGDTIPISIFVPIKQKYVSRIIQKLDSDSNVVEEFRTITEAQNAGYRNVYRVVTGRQTTCGGFKFKYKENQDIV